MPQRPPPARFLESSEWIDHEHPAVAEAARRLASPGGDAAEVARRCFEWVRDEVLHSADHRTGPVTCRASDALLHRAGYCFAKSHLLAALLRANGIPAGLSYQRLALGDGRFTLHGLVSVWLPGHGWIRADPRGLKPGLEARFEPPAEHLPFRPQDPGETDLPGVHAEPWPEIVACLTRHATWEAVLDDLPDRAP